MLSVTSGLRPSIDFVIPCGRPDSPAARETLRAIEDGLGSIGGRIFVVGANLKDLRGRARSDRITWIETDRLLWPAANRNLGARASTADIVCFVDDDCAVSPDFAERAVRLFAAEPGLAAVNGQIRSWPETYWSRAYDLLLFGPTLGQRPVRGTVSFASAMAVRRVAFEAVGGFDEQMRTGEDHDFACRLRAAGAATLYAPDLAVRHEHGRTGARAVLHALYERGLTSLPLERRLAAAGRRRQRVKLALRPIHPLVVPALIGLRLWRILRENRGRTASLLPALPALLAGILIFEAGRTVRWWRR